MYAEERASLDRIEPWLRGIAVAVWLFPGVTRFDPTAAWFWPWLAYGLALLARGRLGRSVDIVMLGAQSVAVLALPRFGLVGFEGLLGSIVVVQVPLVLSLRAAVLWALLQLPIILIDVIPYNTTRALFEIAGAYSTFSAFALLLYWLRLQERKARAELAQSNASLLATRAMLVEGSRQAERLRISRELHDSLGHHLAALGIQLDIAQRQLPSNDSLVAARGIARDSLGEVRKVVSTMQQEGIDLVSALKALAGGIPAPKIHVEAPDSLTLDNEASHALFRCVQEAITNSVKHSAAKNVWVQITPSKITVRDDGIGAATFSTGNGLNGMRARLEQLGGTVRFQSNKGFTVELELPK